MRKINRVPNRLEKLIQAEIKKECRPRMSSLWGQPCNISPAFVDTGRGDRKQLVWVQSTDSRPDYYVLRIDSRENVEAEDYPWDDKLLCPIEERYDNVDNYEWSWQNGKYIGKYKYDENEPIKEEQWPMLSWGGGSWGVIKNFGLLTKQQP